MKHDGSAMQKHEPTTTQELTVLDLQIRISATHTTLHGATGVAIVLALLGVEPVVCAMLPSTVIGIPAALWAWRDWRAAKRRCARLRK